MATITADEGVMAGSSGGIFTGEFSNLKDSSNYLKINTNFWTMTPAGYYILDGRDYIYFYSFVIYSNGRII